MTAFISNLLREPLVQFLLLGGLIFGADLWVTSQQDDPRLIVVDDARYQELQQIFVEGQGREPSANEMKNMIVKWAENEVLYREALSMGLENGDDMIRNRIILKLRNILFNNAIAENPTEGELTEFFEFHRRQYDIPEKFDIEQFIASDLDSATEAQMLADTLNAGSPLPELYQNNLRSYQQRPSSNLAALFGADTQAALLAAETGHWIVLQQAGHLRLARIAQRHPAQQVQLRDVKSAVTRDWKKFRYDIQLADQTRAIADRYSIKMSLSPQLEAKMQLSISNKELHPATASGEVAAPRAAMN
ncbi:MAG: peptidyl-prolyl cis-trans isomerase [Ketobacter sp.]|nr:MAG: peptidyl-prolyl cis-trans isomerase [Ketobacter sp.]